MFQKIRLWWRQRRLKKAMTPGRGRPRARFMSGGIRIQNAELVGVNGIDATVGDPLTVGGPKDERKEALPIEVLHEIEGQEEVNLEDLDAKLKLLEERAILYAETMKRGVPEELLHAICVVKARKKYHLVEQYIPWKTTTDERITKLCKKYKLRFGPVTDFVPDFPEEVLEEVGAFTKIYEKVVDKMTDATGLELFIIAPPELFRPAAKGDPILLAKSPFGDFFYVLCAWDKEVDYVGDLLA